MRELTIPVAEIWVLVFGSLGKEPCDAILRRLWDSHSSHTYPQIHGTAKYLLFIPFIPVSVRISSPQVEWKIFCDSGYVIQY